MSDKALEERLAKAKAAVAAGAAKRAEQDAEREVLEEIERLERRAKDDVAIAAAEAAHGPVGKKIAVVETDLGAVIVKRAHPAKFKQWCDLGSERQLKSVEIEKFVRPCVVHPDAAALDQIFEELPATPARLANAVYELAQGRSKEVQGK